MGKKRIWNWKLFLISAIALIALFGCGGSGGSGGSGGGYDIVDQPLQGVIEGNSYTFASGYASVFSGECFCELYNIAPPTGTDPWSYFYPSPYQSVIFSIPMAVGTYTLKFDFSGGPTQTATLYNTLTSMNTICDQGSIRIDSIDLGGGVMKGAIAARQSGDSSSWVNGSFTIPIEP
jgi:hypothetical protein